MPHWSLLYAKHSMPNGTKHPGDGKSDASGLWV